MQTVFVQSALDYLEQNRGFYPYVALAPVGDPRPENNVVATATRSGYIVCPHQNTAYWAFKLRMDRDWFLSSFPHTRPEHA